MTTYKYVKCTTIPSGLRWDIPRRNQGQTIEVAYASLPATRHEADDGAAYKRVTDRSDGSVAYYTLALVDEAP